jgi:hypothetical protein
MKEEHTLEERENGSYTEGVHQRLQNLPRL